MFNAVDGKDRKSNVLECKAGIEAMLLVGRCKSSD